MESAAVASSSRRQASLGPMAAATTVRSGLSLPRSSGMLRAEGRRKREEREERREEIEEGREGHRV